MNNKEEIIKKLHSLKLKKEKKMQKTSKSELVKIGKRLSLAIKNAGFKHTFAFSKKCKISSGNMSLYEKGATCMTIQTALKIVKVLNVSLDWLFTGKEYKGKNQ